MKDNFSRQSDLYAKYRPSYPPMLYDYIFSHVPLKSTAWDCATGNGQAAKELARSFEKVYATDTSKKQIENAIRLPNIHYSVQAAEQTNFPASSFDLITVAQALHWFHFEEFYQELRRVAKPGAIFAAWTYSLIRITPEIDRLIEAYHYNTLGFYWDAERQWVDEEYKTIPFPFKKISTPVFEINDQWTIEELGGYLGTWSAVQKFIAENGYDPLPELLSGIKSFWKSERMRIRFPVHLLMAEIEK